MQKQNGLLLSFKGILNRFLFFYGWYIAKFIPLYAISLYSCLLEGLQAYRKTISSLDIID